DDMDRPEPLLRRAERRQQAAHAIQAEAHAEQLEAEEVALGVGLGPAIRRERCGACHPAAPSSSASSRRLCSSLSRSACTTRSGALTTKPSLASLPSAR